MSDLIFIHQLPTRATIGVHRFERALSQKLLISLEMETDIRQAAQSDTIEHTLNYDAISQFVDQTVRASDCKLLETLAESLVDKLFSTFSMQAIRLTIEKPGAISYTQQVGLTIYRHKKDYQS